MITSKNSSTILDFRALCVYYNMFFWFKSASNGGDTPIEYHHGAKYFCTTYKLRQQQYQLTTWRVQKLKIWASPAEHVLICWTHLWFSIEIITGTDIFFSFFVVCWQQGFHSENWVKFNFILNFNPESSARLNIKIRFNECHFQTGNTSCILWQKSAEIKNL